MTRLKTLVVVALFPLSLAVAQTQPGEKVAGASSRLAEGAAGAEEKPKAGVPALDERRAERGREVYERLCISCHGGDGDGNGYAAKAMDPRPRDFTRGTFKCRSTPTGTLPVDDDLMRTLREGLYHTQMPSWAFLGDTNLRDVAEYLKTLSPRWKTEAPGQPISYAKEPADAGRSRERGMEVWKEQGCFNCHGQGGKGDGPASVALLDDWGNKIVPFDFSASPHRKCGTSDRDLYRSFMTGLDGTPMAAFPIPEEDVWHLIHFLRTLQREPSPHQGLFTSIFRR